jgi:hypothetical protein
MTFIKLKNSFFILFIAFCSHINAQNINYTFNGNKEIIDSITSIVNTMETKHGVKMGDFMIFACIEYCDSGIDIFFSRYSENRREVNRLAGKTNRFIILNESRKIPVLFDVDILSEEMYDNIRFIGKPGYHLRLEKNERYEWTVKSIQVVF